MSKAIQLPGFVKHTAGDDLPAHLSGSARGNENVTSQDVVIPKLNLIQKMSPQVDSIGAKAGHMHLSTTDQLFDELYVVNLYYSRTFNVFKKRDLGGGFFGIFDTRLDADKALKESGNPNDYDIQETGTHNVLLLSDKGEPITPARMYMSGTKLGVSNAWNSTIATQNTDRFASVWKLSTVMQKAGNNTWHNFQVEYAGLCNEALYAEAEELYTSISGMGKQEAA